VNKLNEKKFDIFSEDHDYEVLLLRGETKKLKSRMEINEYLLNPSNPIPEMSGQKTWVSNYVLTFWMPLMGVGAFTVYLQLSKMAYGEKDYSFPTASYLAMMMGVSKRSVQRYMRELQDLNFVVVIHVKDKKKGTNVQNLYLLSRTIPFLTDKQVELLPKRLQDEHKAFIEDTKERKITKLSFD
jgi:DNA-binding transcriptional regulator YhcF (GntR family)